MTRRCLLILACAAVSALTLTVHAQAKPDFSGVWTLVPDKSDFGPMPAPTSVTRTITHKDPSLKIVSVQVGGPNGDATIETTYSTDGKPTTNDIMGSTMSSTAKWDGTAIVVNSTVTMQGTDLTLTDRYELSDGGKTLTDTREITTDQGAFTTKLVFAKKQG